MKYNGDQLKAMADKIDIVDYISATEELQRKGDKYFIKCPFHAGDDTPSLCIYPEDNKWFCFGCRQGSSIYDWMVKYEGLSFREAVEKVATLTESDISGCVESESMNFLKELKKQDNNKVVCKKSDRQILDFEKDYVEKYIDEPPQEWLDEDMSKEALKTYNIRIDPNANRIVYPVFDSAGNMIGVKGRTRIPSFKELGLSKYMNYNKVGVLDYFQGWQQALPEIKRKKSVIIFEGIKSCIKAYGWGITNTIASETSKLSDEQIGLLIKTKISEVIIGFDSDQAYKDIVTNPKVQMLRNFTKVSIIRDTKGLLGEKESPVDRGEKVFRELLEKRYEL